jgi:hypothetical protein
MVLQDGQGPVLWQRGLRLPDWEKHAQGAGRIVGFDTRSSKTKPLSASQTIAETKKTPERWQSGRMHRIRNPAYSFNCTEGSNPSFSAKSLYKSMT